MAFDRVAAKAAGYTDEEIEAYLAQSQPADAPAQSPLEMAASRSVKAGEAIVAESTPGRTLTQLAGGIAGAVVGGKLAGGTGVRAGKVAGETLASGAARVAGAMAGGTGAELGYQAATGEPVQVGEALVAGGKQALAETLGQGAVRVLNRVIKPVRAPLDPEAARLQPGFEAVGGEFLPHQMMPESGSMGVVTGVAKGGWFSGTGMRQAEKRIEQATERLASATADRLSAKTLQEVAPEDAAIALAETIAGGKAAHDTARRAMYQALDEQYKVPVSLPAMKTQSEVAMVNSMLRRTAPIKAAAEAAPTPVILGPTGKPAKAVEAAAPETLNFDRMADLRSQLMAKGRAPGDPVVRRQAKMLAKAVDEQMEAAATKFGDPAFLEDWRAASAFAKEGKRTFDNKFIANLAADPKVAERFGEQLAGTGGAEMARKIQMTKEALDYAKKVSPELDTRSALDSMRAGWFSTKVLKAEATGDLKAQTLLTQLNQPQTQRTMRALFEPEQHQAIMDFAKTAQIAQRKPEGGGQMVVQLMQPGALMTGVTLAVTGTAPVSGAVMVPAVLVAPSLVSRLLTNPKTARWLTHGLNTPLRSPARAGLGTRILGAVIDLAQQGELTMQFPPGQEPGSPQSNLVNPAGPRLEQGVQ